MLKVDFQLTQTDVYRSNVAIVIDNVKKPILIIALGFVELCALASTLGTLLNPKADGSSISFLAESIALVLFFPGLALFAIYVSPYLSAKSLYKKNANLQGPISWSFSEDLITSQMTTGKSELLWTTFIKAREASDLFLLYPQKYFAYPIPKRAFANDAEMSAFRELVVRYIQDTGKMKGRLKQ